MKRFARAFGSRIFSCLHVTVDVDLVVVIVEVVDLREKVVQLG